MREVRNACNAFGKFTRVGLPVAHIAKPAGVQVKHFDSELRGIHDHSAGESIIGRAIIEEVADQFDMLPRGDRGRQMGEEREAPARIFSAAGRAELWAAGTGQPAEGESSQAVGEEAGRGTTSATDEVNTAFHRSGLVGE